MRNVPLPRFESIRTIKAKVVNDRNSLFKENKTKSFPLPEKKTGSKVTFSMDDQTIIKLRRGRERKKEIERRTA